MIGNDIIDLEKAKRESDWQRRGFLDKLFTSGEQQLIWSSGNAELMIWNLWSRKEAAYKIYNRQSGERFFSPRRFVCGVDSVIFEGHRYYTQTQINAEFKGFTRVQINFALGKAYDDLTKPRKGQHEANGQPTTDNGSEARQSDPEGHPGDTLPSHR